MRSLFLVGLPRSLTTACYHLAKEALGLREPEWVTDGEILNTHRFLFGPTDETARFLTQVESQPGFDAALSHLETVVRTEGFIYKDVVQPFAVAAFLEKASCRVLHLRREVEDVAFHMQRRGWLTAGRDGLATLLRAQHVLDGIPQAVTIDFDQLIFDETVLSEAIGTQVTYLKDAFQHDRDAVLALRQSDEYKRLAERVTEVRESMKTVEAPTIHAPPAVGQRRRTVMLVSDAQAPTGFTRVGYEIAHSLHQEFDVHQVGINYHGGSHELPWSLYPAAVDDTPLEERIGPLTSMVQPDLVLALNDPWVVATLAERLRAQKYEGKLLGYCPVDAAPLPTSCGSGLGQLDLLVAYTEFGRKAFTELFPAADIDPPPLAVIPHGVDTQTFDQLVAGDPQASRRSAKAQVFPAEAKFLDSFVVLNANRNQPRKCIDVTLRAFAEFARDKPDNVLLYLHMGKVDLGWDVVALGERFGITDRLVMSTAADQMPELSEDNLNLMYNACDVGLNTSGAEGWGLVSFEHASTGAAQVVPDTEVQQELWGGVAELVPPSLVSTAVGQIADWHLLASSDVAAALEKLYSDPDLLTTNSENCRRHARQTRFSWSEIGKSWVAQVEATL